MNNLIMNIPNLNTNLLTYIFDNMSYKHKDNTLWLDFGIRCGGNANYISLKTDDKLYGFYNNNNGFPEKWDNDTFIWKNINSNIIISNGPYNETVENFITTQDKKISFIHIDCDYYSSSKYVLNTIKNYIDKDCIIIFDELVNYPGFDGPNGELKALYEFITENNVDYEWIGMNGTLNNIYGSQNAALKINSILG